VVAYYAILCASKGRYPLRRFFQHSLTLEIFDGIGIPEFESKSNNQIAHQIATSINRRGYMVEWEIDFHGGRLLIRVYTDHLCRPTTPAGKPTRLGVIPTAELSGVIESLTIQYDQIAMVPPNSEVLFRGKRMIASHVRAVIAESIAMLVEEERLRSEVEPC
jgi:hypothetical protein